MVEFLKFDRRFGLKTALLECAWVLSSSAGYNLPLEVVHERLVHIRSLPKKYNKCRSYSCDKARVERIL